MELQQIAVSDILVGEHALRLGMDDEKIADLAESIRRLGVLVPLVVCPEGDKFALVAGHRRFAAAAKCNLGTVPCIVRKTEQSETKEIALAENIFREDLSPVELASSIRDSLNSGSMDITTIAAGLRRSEHWVARQIAMLDWPMDVLEVIHNGQLSVSAASNLAMVTDDCYRSFLLRNAVEGGASARSTAAWLQAWRSSAPPEQAVEAEPLPAGPTPMPAVPQAPCIVCSQVFRTDQLSHVPVCVSCIQAIRNPVC